jgi:alkaline phosphatase D
MKSNNLDRMEAPVTLLPTLLSRRHFLGGLSVAAGYLVAARHGTALGQAPVQAVKGTPFTLGVASGDPLPDGVVLWTRLAVDPLNGGGMPQQSMPVRWQIATDQSMKSIVQKGTVLASPTLGHSVHVEVVGLQPGRHYWYQFESGGVLSPLGRTKTAPAPGARPEQLRFAFASCQNWTNGYYAAYRHMATQDLDFVLHLGDYIYEGNIGQNSKRAESVPANVRPEPMALEGYRLRYALYKLDPDLQAAHAAFPFLVTWDDHEVENNYAAALDQNGSAPAEFLLRRAAAYQAYYENMPLRRSSMPVGPDMMLYRRFSFGDLAQINILDTRQYRSDQACGEGRKPRCSENLDLSRVMLGGVQEKWLLGGLDSSPARWNVLAQQLIMAQFARHSSAGDNFSMDSWDGYPAERARLMRFLEGSKVRNPVVLAGDSHINLVSDLKTDFDKASSPTVGAEFAGTAISSGGLTRNRAKNIASDVATQPHLKYFEGIKRGYVSCTLGRSAWRSDFMQVEDVLRADSPVSVGASWAVEDGRPGVQKA